MSPTMSVALVGPTTARGEAVLAALEPLADAIALTGLTTGEAGGTYAWRGDRPVAAFDPSAAERFDAIVSAEPIAVEASTPVLSLLADAAPVFGETIGRVQRIPDPVAAAVARVIGPFADRLEALDLTVLDSASVYERAGMDALRDQTIALLNFRPVEPGILERRLAFDVLFDDARREARVSGDLHALCPAAPQADVRRVVVPTFIGAAIDLRVRGAVTRSDLQASLDAAGFGVGVGLAELTEEGGVQAIRPSETGDGVRVWLMVDDLRWGAGTAALEFLARIRASAV